MGEQQIVLLLVRAFCRTPYPGYARMSLQLTHKLCHCLARPVTLPLAMPIASDKQRFTSTAMRPTLNNLSVSGDLFNRSIRINVPVWNIEIDRECVTTVKRVSHQVVFFDSLVLPAHFLTADTEDRIQRTL